MRIVKLKGTNKNFICLCKELETYQFNLLPELRKTNYSLTNDLNEVLGYVVFDKKTPVGCMGIKKINNNICELVRVFVCEKYRKRGLATILFNKVQTLANKLGFKFFELVVWSKAQDAVRFYKKLGFVLQEEKTSEFFCGYKYALFQKNIIKT